jgi:hypothetical protein
MLPDKDAINLLSWEWEMFLLTALFHQLLHGPHVSTFKSLFTQQYHPFTLCDIKDFPYGIHYQFRALSYKLRCGNPGVMATFLIPLTILCTVASQLLKTLTWASGLSFNSFNECSLLPQHYWRPFMDNHVDFSGLLFSLSLTLSNMNCFWFSNMLTVELSTLTSVLSQHCPQWAHRLVLLKLLGDISASPFRLENMASYSSCLS